VKEDVVSRVMREMGKKGGKKGGPKGGKARMNSLTQEQRRELARKAANARWEKARTKKRASTPERKEPPEK
jgi:hypothetical protein